MGRRYWDISRVLDEFLLTGNVPAADVQDFIRRMSAQLGGMHHLQSLELSNGLPLDYTEVMESVIRLRLVLAQDFEPNPEMVDTLLSVCALNRLLGSYIRGEVSERELERNMHMVTHPRASKMLGLLLSRLRYDVAFLGYPPEDESSTERLDIVDTCVRTMDRLRQYWYSVLE